jgi:hypothetical protein
MQDAWVHHVREQPGVNLDRKALKGAFILDTDPKEAQFGADYHRNMVVILPPKGLLQLPGPTKQGRLTMQKNGVYGMGQPAGDGYHAWLPIDVMLGLTAIVPAAKIPLEHLRAIEHEDMGRQDWQDFVELERADEAGEAEVTAPPARPPTTKPAGTRGPRPLSPPPPPHLLTNQTVVVVESEGEEPSPRQADTPDRS